MTKKSRKTEHSKKISIFTCGFCGLEFEGAPYATLNVDGELNNLCNAGCLKYFLDLQKDALEREIRDVVLMTDEAIAFMSLLELRADFSEILDELKDEVTGVRCRWECDGTNGEPLSNQ